MKTSPKDHSSFVLRGGLLSHCSCVRLFKRLIVLTRTSSGFTNTFHGLFIKSNAYSKNLIVYSFIYNFFLSNIILFLKKKMAQRQARNRTQAFTGFGCQGN